MDLSVVIICKNEEDRIGRCLAALPKGVQIVVLDSHSEDRSVEIAKNFGAEVSFRAFDDFEQQKNAACALANRRWVLSLDCDEVMDEKLADEIVKAVNAPWADAYRLPRQLVFMGKKMRFGKTSDKPLRLFQRGKVSFSGAIHERVIGSGRIGCLKGRLFHHSYRDLSDYFARFNRYTSLIAKNHWQKKTPLPFAMTLRPYWEFFSRYFLRLGFLDGYQGYIFALFSSFYAYTKYLKLAEFYEKKALVHE